MAHDVFISHAQKDQSIAEAICERLESAGIRCWMTARDILEGEDWTKATRRALGSSSVVLLLFSENANASPHIQKEIVHAYYTRRVMIPLRLTNTLPQRDFLFYLDNVRWFDVLNPPPEEQLEGLIAHIRGLIPVGTNISRQAAGRTTATWNLLNSRIGAIRASNYRTLGILKWAAIATSLVAVGGLIWAALREPIEKTSIVESHPRSIYPDSTVSPKPSPQTGGDALSPAPTYTFTRLGLWQPVDVGATPFAQQESQGTHLTASAEGSASATPSPPPHARLLPPTGIHEAPHYHHQPHLGLRTLEAQKHAALVTRERDALESQLKEIETKLQATQKHVDILATQRDELQRQLEESKAQAQTAQKNADIVASERDALRNQLREAENRVITAEKNKELATGQIDALQRQLEENEAKVRTVAKNDGDVVKSQRDALQSRLVGTEVEAKTVQKNADLATRQRSVLEGQLRKVQEEKAQLTKQNADLAAFYQTAPEIRPQKEGEDAQEYADLMANQPEAGQIQPPNPSRNENPDASIQPPDSPVRSARP